MPLYAAVTAARWFDVPEGATLPEGSFVVRTMVGRQRAFDESALATFEVDQATARDLARAQLVALVAQLEGGIGTLGSLLQASDRPTSLLDPLKQILAGVDGRLRREGDPQPAPPPTPEQLTTRLEAWLRQALDDPTKIERLRDVAQALRQAAAQMRSTSAE